MPNKQLVYFDILYSFMIKLITYLNEYSPIDFVHTFKGNVACTKEKYIFRLHRQSTDGHYYVAKKRSAVLQNGILFFFLRVHT
jgi:hypothetical protein